MLTYRVLKNKDVLLWVDLFKTVWPSKTMDERYIQWSFVDCPVKISLVGAFLKEDESKREIAVGSRGAWDIPLYYGGKKISCTQLGDTSVHPKGRRQGVFSKMTTMFLDEIENKYDLIYNISVDAARKGYEKLGWHYIDGLHTWISGRNIFSLPKIYLNRKKEPDDLIDDAEKYIVNNGELYSWETIAESVVEMFASEKSLYNNKLYVNKEKEFLTWKSLKPVKKYFHLYHKDSYYAIISLKKRGSVIEVSIGYMILLGNKATSFKAMMKALKKNVDYDIVSIIMSDGHPYVPLMKNCFIKRNKNLHFGIKEVKKNENNELPIYNINSWAITSFDLDTY